jgi:hypothetical protein
MPIPLGHCGQLTSPPSSGPFGRAGIDRLGTVIDGDIVGFGVLLRGGSCADTVAVGEGDAVGVPTGVASTS